MLGTAAITLWLILRRHVQGMDLAESLTSGAPAPLPHAALVRRLMPSLHRLRSLSALNLAGNLFTRVPAALGQLSALEFLDMSCNPELQARLQRQCQRCRLCLARRDGISVLPCTCLKMAGLLHAC